MAVDALAWLLADLGRSRSHLRLFAIGEVAAGLASAVRLRSIAELPPSTPDVAASDGAVLLAARRQTVTSLVVLGVPPSAAVPSRTR